jgi:hypothetical protein
MGNILLENAVYYLDAAVLDIHKPEHRCRLAILRAQILSLARDIAEDQEAMGCMIGRGHRHEPSTLNDLAPLDTDLAERLEYTTLL